MTSNDVRRQFLDFFRDRNHVIVPSAPVVPLDDPTLMFTNAGMNQFKDVFLGSGSRAYRRAADSQKCIRAGGKHNDLDDVGRDTYHHTFFEMLGNWSFGDYFKAEAIQWAWELLTGVWGIEKSRLHATYFEGDPSDRLGPDDEAADLWLKVTDIDPSHVHPGGKKDNFWEMGESGPCGPCSEIHIDLTPDRLGAALVNAGDHRVIEIWNLVFIQFNRDGDARLSPLPDKHVDTGMGFERICAVLQGRSSNYDTDVFVPIFAAIRERTAAPEYRGTVPVVGDARAASGADWQTMIDVSYRVIADHLRCLTFAITDGAVPSNEGRGYVLRRILRRAVRYGRQCLGAREPFLCDLVRPLVDHMGEAYGELRSAYGGRNVERVAELLREEEGSFGRTLDRGIRLFDEAADHASKRHHGRVSGADAFKLHDTYGFPIDLTEQMALERGLTVNIGEYERLMDEARGQARSAAASATTLDVNVTTALPATDDSPKYAEEDVVASLLGYVQNGDFIDSGEVPAGTPVAMILDRTCFYGEQGGQVGDVGEIIRSVTDPIIAARRGDADPRTGVTFRVNQTRRHGETVLHIGEKVADAPILRVGDRVVARVSRDERGRTMKNHTATHMLNWALREVLGAGVQQKGSLVDSEKTRFDFSHNRPLATEELARVEGLVNDTIEAGLPVYAAQVDQAAARRINTLRAVFGEKYPDIVRVVSIGAPIDEMLNDPTNPTWMKHAVEFCGGTHLANSRQAERFALISEEGVAKGVRRVVGVTAEAARRAESSAATLMERIERLQPAPAGELADGLHHVQREIAEATMPLRDRLRLQERLAALQSTARDAEREQAAQAGGAVIDCVAQLLRSAESVGGIHVVVGQVPPASADALRSAIDWVRNKTDGSAVMLAMSTDGKVTLVAGMSRSAVDRGLKSGDLVREVAHIVGGKGGGRPDMAQGGGTRPDAIPEALQRAKEWIIGRLK